MAGRRFARQKYEPRRFGAGEWCITGAVKIQAGKGDKERMVYVASLARRSLRRYLKTRWPLTNTAPLWLNRYGRRLEKRGVMSVVEQRAKAARVPVPGLHDFRRAFALTMWRNGIDIYTISRLMGHSSIEVTKRYIEPFDDDLRLRHAQGSPVDRAGL